MQLIDQARALPDLRLEPAGDLAELVDRGRGDGHGLGFFGQGEAGGGGALGGIGLLVAEDGGAIVLIALRIAAGNGPGLGQPVQEGEQVVGIAAGNVEAEVEVDRAVLLDDGSQALSKLLVALSRLDELEIRGGRL